ncbi:MAG: hypothetical protein ACTH31_14005 [Pseudoclavibacter sp.]
MRNVFSKLAVATVATALTAGGLLLAAPAMPASAVGAPGTLGVTYFNDQQPNGQYDEGETLNPGLLYAQDASGQWFGTGAGADGTFSFTDLEPGDYQLYFSLANNRSTAFNVEGNQRMEIVEVPRVTGATWINSTTGERSTFNTTQGDRAVTSVTVAAAGEHDIQVGVSMISSTAQVFAAGAEEPTYDLASVSFMDGDAPVASFESETSGSYLAVTEEGGATQLNFLEETIGLVVEPAHAYEVTSVTAPPGTDESLEVTDVGDGVYTVVRSDLTSSFDRAEFVVEVAEAPTPTPTETTVPTETTDPTETSEPTATTTPTESSDATDSPVASTPGGEAGDGLATTDGGISGMLLTASVAGAVLLLGGGVLLMRRRA